MMEPVSLSWLVASATSPLVAVLALWTLYVFHTYRRRWRTVDLFLVAVVSEELVGALLTFAAALLRLMGGVLGPPCTALYWGQVAHKTLQVATLTSMVADRALTVRWPYRYRFSVRRNQIRYHLAALALVSGLVGGAALFAAPVGCPPPPPMWDTRFAIFLLSLHSALVLGALVCMLQVEVHRVRNGAPSKVCAPECVSPDLPSATGTCSPLDTHSSAGSTRALHRPSRQASRRPYTRATGTTDLRWPSVALTALLAFLLNHLPHLVLVGLSVWHPPLWTSWHEAALSWMGLVEGLLLPLLLFWRDPPLRIALRRTFQRRSGALSPLVGDEGGPFQMYLDKEQLGRKQRGPFGSVTPIGIITNYRRAPSGRSKKQRRKGKYTLPGLHSGDSVLPRSCLATGAELSKLSCADLTSLEMWREEEEENFYATLSDDFSTFSCKSGDDSALSDELRMSEEIYGGSFTTVANDDFEFHDTRPCGGEVKMKPALISPDTPPSRRVSFRGNLNGKVNLPKVFQERALEHVTSRSASRVEEEDRKDPSFFILPPPKEWNQEESSDPPTPESNQDLQQPLSGKLGPSGHPKSTSFSMTDLDLIHKKDAEQDAEATFVLPVKSESTMSLYRLNVEQDVDQMTMTPSRSETNVNGDSGFGSGAQSTNPVWSGFLCRKPSDPFWNMRKPTAAIATSTPSRQYPAVLHPRMRKIPWISAWKKLDENSVHNERNQIYASPDAVDWKDNLGKVQDKDPAHELLLDWQDNVMYEGNLIQPKLIESLVDTIDEELTDFNSPAAFNADYNISDFVKESGVLMENAYGKIVRDDCGVQVNFYGKGVQYSDKDVFSDPKDNGNVFERSVEPVHLIEPLPMAMEPECIFQPYQTALIGNMNPEHLQNRHAPLKHLFESVPNIPNDTVQDPTRDSQAYSNAFGLNENVLTRCDHYLNIPQVGAFAAVDNEFVKSVGNEAIYANPKFSASNEAVIYGQLNKLEGMRKNKYSPGKSPLRSKELKRRESDNRGNRCGIRRREGRTRSDPRSNFLNDPDIQAKFAELSAQLEKSTKIPKENNIEIEMQTVSIDHPLNNRNVKFGKAESNIPHSSGNTPNRLGNNEQKRSNFDRNLNFRESGENVSKPLSKVDRKDSRGKVKDPQKEQKSGLERKPSGRRASAEKRDGLWDANANHRNIPVVNPANVERRESNRRINERKESGLPVRVDSRNLAKSVLHQGESKPIISYHNGKSGDNEGLWVNAIPFSNSVNEENNSPKRDIRRPLSRSPRKSNLPRRESDSKGNARVKRKVSASRPKAELSDVKLWPKDNANRAKASDIIWTGARQDDFAKFRNRCEDNFTHIQNLNRERSSERENSNGGQGMAIAKKNGNVPMNGDPFGRFEENGKIPVLENSKPSPYDANDNCRDKKLAITDFL